MTRSRLFILLIFLLLGVVIVGALLQRWQPELLRNLIATDLTIRWTTESELDIFGYNLYRSDTPDGEFVKINDELLPPAVDPFIGGEHLYIDEGVIRGRTYYYQLESVTRYGGTRIEGPFAISAGR